MDVEQFRSNRLVRQAVERNFGIIGEAMRRLAASDATTAKTLGPAERIISFQNMVTHGYDVLEYGLVWKITSDHLPALLQRVTELLDEYDANNG